MFSLLWLKKREVPDSGLSGSAPSLCGEAEAVSEPLESNAVSVQLRTAPGIKQVGVMKKREKRRGRAT